MITTGNKALIVTGGISVLILALVFLIYPLFRGGGDSEEQISDTQIIPPSQLQVLPSDQGLQGNGGEVIQPFAGEPMTNDIAAQRAEIERTTRLFVERFGSYSNYSGFENISSILSLMTPSMQNYANGLADTDDRGSSSSEYYGVTTRLLGLNIDIFIENDVALVDIIVQEQIQQGLQGEIELLNREGRVELLYQNQKWLVHGLFYN